MTGAGPEKLPLVEVLRILKKVSGGFVQFASQIKKGISSRIDTKETESKLAGKLSEEDQDKRGPGTEI